MQVYDSKAGQFDQFLGEATPARASASTSQAKLMAQPSLRYAAARRSSHQVISAIGVGSNTSM